MKAQTTMLSQVSVLRDWRQFLAGKAGIAPTFADEVAIETALMPSPMDTRVTEGRLVVDRITQPHDRQQMDTIDSWQARNAVNSRMKAAANLTNATDLVEII